MMMYAALRGDVGEGGAADEKEERRRKESEAEGRRRENQKYRGSVQKETELIRAGLGLMGRRRGDGSKTATRVLYVRETFPVTS